MKKKVIFMVINMNVGGTERALLNMIEEMPEDTYDITILMLEKYGGFLNEIPDRVKQLTFNEYSDVKSILNEPPKKVVTNYFQKGLILKGMVLSFIFLFCKLTRNNSILFKYLLRHNHKLEREYDIAVAYAGPMDFISYFVASKINAKRKIQWIHFDVNKIGFNKKFVKKTYEIFDQIYTVSKEGKESLISEIPELSNKTKQFSNIISKQKIIALSNQGEGFTDSFKGLRILTVGRLSLEKGQDLAIKVMAKLKMKGFNVRWYCIGDGGDKETYKKQIHSLNLEQDFKLLGPRLNPYPFMKQCDIYVQPSRHEGYCLTLAEAKCLYKPIVTTNFTGANEQIINEKTGMIRNFDELELVQALEKLIKNQQLRDKFQENLSKELLEHIGKRIKLSI